MQSWIRACAIAAIVPVLTSAQTKPAGPAPDVVRSAAGDIRVERLATLEFPWGVAALPDGRLLITEKPGRLRIFADGKLSGPVEGVPKVVYRGGKSEQGGLLDVAIDPAFAKNRRVYLSYVEAAATQPAGAKETAEPRFGGFLDMADTIVRGGVVARAVLDGNRLTDVQVIWRQEPKTLGRGHFGNRIVFGRDGTMFITSGERMRFDPAQDLASNLGKVVRINTDGSIPTDNPFVGKSPARGDIWSVGHRNVLAAAVHPNTGQLWLWEMGPLGGDELNLVRPGANYGWPVVSDGDNYDKSAIPDHKTRPEFEAPIKTWTPVIAPSGAIFYDGALFPWRGNVLVGGLSSMALIRFTVDDKRVISEERIDMKRRVRDVVQGPDGSVVIITDDPKGELLRLTPARPPTR